MKRSNLVTAIDIGTTKIVVIVGEKNEDGEFETYKKDDGQSYYKTYKNENEKAIIFFKKVSSFFVFSNNLEDANQEIDELIEKKKIKEYKPAPTPYNDYSSGGGMFL